MKWRALYQPSWSCSGNRIDECPGGWSFAIFRSAMLPSLHLLSIQAVQVSELRSRRVDFRILPRYNLGGLSSSPCRFLTRMRRAVSRRRIYDVPFFHMDALRHCGVLESPSEDRPHWAVRWTLSVHVCLGHAAIWDQADEKTRFKVVTILEAGQSIAKHKVPSLVASADLGRCLH